MDSRPSPTPFGRGVFRSDSTGVRPLDGRADSHTPVARLTRGVTETYRVPAQTDRTMVVTGANSGLGREATALFARAGADVVLACRSTERGERAADEIADEHPSVGRPQLDVRACDLADLSSVSSFAAGVRESYDAVDALCNNAGVMAIPRRETTDGFEAQLGINHLGHFALTGELLPVLADDARVVTQSSNAHRTGWLDFDDMHWDRRYQKWAAYGRSKLANVLFARELDRRLSDRSIRSLACHPGWAATNLQLRTGRESSVPGYETVMQFVNGLIAQSAEMGALPMVHAVTRDLPGGSYVGPDGVLDMRGLPELQEPSARARDDANARRLWEWSVEQTGVEPLADAPVTE